MRDVVAIQQPACNTPSGYEPPVAVDTGEWPAPPPDSLYSLGAGVIGYAVYDNQKRIDIRVIIAEREGSGAVGTFLGSLSPRCVFKCVISNLLREMLMRRQWTETYERDPMTGEDVDVWAHPSYNRHA